jgi:peptidoglycan lytic transglycosylase
VAQYLGALREDPYHPLAQMARLRLAASDLAPVARAEGLRRAASHLPGDLYAAWLLLGGDEPRGVAALAALRAHLAHDRRAAPFLDLKPVPPPDWPLWAESPQEPEELLLALGLWHEGEPAVRRYFPLSDPSLAFTASLYLAESGEIPTSMLIAESLLKRVPASVPTALLSGQLRRLLYPFAHDRLIVEAAKRNSIDPFLVAAIIREESRFDPRALSAASARGLTQFIYPTARQIAAGQAALTDLAPEDLYRPEVSIALGAAYLAQLESHFHGAVPLAVAAYNAGEAQARLWRSYCFSSELAEYFTKVTFGQTRAYLRKVLSSRAQYVEIYALPAGAAP